MVKRPTIFVFGSNLAGRHGAGSAQEALRHFGAIYGQGIGLQGSSYAIPTKDKDLKVLPLPTIHKYVDNFLAFATSANYYDFYVVPIGCGLAGYTPEEIAPMFYPRLYNVFLPKAFLDVMSKY